MASALMILPNYLVIGAQKSGTTWLAAMLEQHPDVFASNPKEIHFFDLASNFARGLDWYASHFEGAGAALAIGEATPNYLGVDCELPAAAAAVLAASGHPITLARYPDAPPDIARRIQSALPDLRLVAILRNPVDRAISAFYHHVRMKRIAPFRRILDTCGEHGILSMGFYHAHLQKWLELYPRERCLILVYEEDLLGEKHETLRRVYRHLGVRDDFKPREAERRLNERSSDPWMVASYYAPSLARRVFRAVPALHGLPWPDLSITESERQTLRATYLHERPLLENLLGRSLDCWE